MFINFMSSALFLIINRCLLMQRIGGLGVLSARVSYKLLMLACRGIYEGTPTNACLVKSGILDGLYSFCLKLESMKNHFCDCSFDRPCWEFLQFSLLGICSI